MKTTTKKKTAINLQALINWMWTEFHGVSTQVAEDKKAAEKDMHRFLTWASNACDHASYHKYLGIYLDVAQTMQKRKKTAEEFLNYITTNMLGESGRAVTSSGIMNNVMENFDRAAKVRIINEMRQAMKYNTFT